MEKVTKTFRHAARAASLLALASANPVSAKNWEDWSGPMNLEALPGSSTAVNTPAVDGCASHSPDGLTIVFNSNRSGADFDLYMATRPSTSEGFGTPVRLPAPVNSSANEACATIANGHRLYFSSDRDDRLHEDVVVDLAVAQSRGAELLEPAANAVAADVDAALADLHRAAVGEEVRDVVPQLAIDVVAIRVL